MPQTFQQLVFQFHSFGNEDICKALNLKFETPPCDEWLGFASGEEEVLPAVQRLNEIGTKQKPMLMEWMTSNLYLLNLLIINKKSLTLS